MQGKFSKTILIFLIIFISSGCTNAKNSIAPVKDKVEVAQKVTIATSFYPIYILTLNVAKDIEGVKVVNITPPQSGCLHDYQLSPTDLKLLVDADFFVINGAGMESFMEKVVSQYPAIKIIEASKDADLLKNQSDGEDNPHLWLSVGGAILQIQNIAEQLAVLDPKNSERYQSNAKAYITELETLRITMLEQISQLSERDIITFHEAFPYFAREFDLNVVAIIEREPGSEPSASELAETIDIVKQSNVKALFIEPQYPSKSAEVIGRETGVKVYTLDPVVSGPMDAKAYVNIMLKNLEVLKEALK